MRKTQTTEKISSEGRKTTNVCNGQGHSNFMTTKRKKTSTKGDLTSQVKNTPPNLRRNCGKIRSNKLERRRRVRRGQFVDSGPHSVR